MMYVGMLASSNARNSSMMSLAAATSSTPAIDNSISEKNSPASCPKLCEALPVASSLVGQASSVSIVPIASAISLTYWANSPTRTVPWSVPSADTPP
jgi:hypothetical protein